MKRVVVTGVSIVTSLGSTSAEAWHNIIAGKSGIKQIPDTLFDTSDLATKIAGFLPTKEDGGPDLDSYISPKEQRKSDRFIHLAVMAAKQAVDDSGWTISSDQDAYETGVIIGSGVGGLSSIAESAIILQEKGPKRVSPFFIPSSLINLASGMVSIMYGFKGPNHAVATACATGSHAIADAARMIANGEASVMISGGAEATVSRLGIAGFNACRALSCSFNDTPEIASRPWDKHRDGFVMAEGSGILVLEEYEHAKKRGAKIYGELIGFGYSGDAYHITAPAEDGEGGFIAMKKALQMAKVSPAQVDYINAHGTSTPMGDLIELRAIKRLFGDAISNVSISSTKSATGHLLGAAGSVEAALCMLAIKDQVLPPTLNLYEPEEECKGIDLVPFHAREKKIRVVMSNSFGFGGTNVSLVFRNA